MNINKLLLVVFFVLPATTLAWGNLFYKFLPNTINTNQIFAVVALTSIITFFFAKGSSYREIVSILLIVIFIIINTIPFTYPLDIIWYINLLIMIFSIVITRYEKDYIKFGTHFVKKFFVLSTFISLFSPLILTKFSLMTPDTRYIYYGDRYAGFGWELVEPSAAFFISLVFASQLSKSFFLHTGVASLVLYLLTGFPSSNSVPIFIIIVVITYIINLSNYNKYILFSIYFIAAFWELIAIQFLSLVFKTMPYLFVTADNLRVFGRFEGASSLLMHDGWIFTLAQQKQILLTNGLHGFSTLGMSLLTFPVMIMVIVALSHISNYKRDYSIVFVQLTMITLLATKTSILLLLILLASSRNYSRDR